MARVAQFRMTLEGDKLMRKKLEHAASDQGMRKVARKATVEFGGELLTLMQHRTPVKTGKLVRSERLVVMVSPKKEDIRIALVAGGGDILYARKVHETHPTHSKFMESVIHEGAATAGPAIARKIDLREVVAA